MTDYEDDYDTLKNGLGPDTEIMENNGEYYLVQGNLDHELTMWRHVSNLLECERNRIQAEML